MTFSFLLALNTSSVLAAEFAAVSPMMLDLSLKPGNTQVESVSLTINPFCIRPFDVDVITSSPEALATNLTGVIENGCGGDTSAFDIKFTGKAAAQQFDLQFVDAEFGDILASIPITINLPSKLEPLLGLLVRKRGIVFKVASSGCTTKDDFQLEVLESFPLQLRLIRIQQDPCDAVVPLGTHVRFTYRELGIQSGEQFRVTNPLATVEVPSS